MSPAPSMKSRNRSDGPADPTGSYVVSSMGPAGPTCPEWLKYGPIERITGVLVSGARPLGRKMSACSCTPSEDGMVACVHSAPAGTGAAPATAGSMASAATADAMVGQNLIGCPNDGDAHSLRPVVDCGLPVQRLMVSTAACLAPTHGYV